MDPSEIKAARAAVIARERIEETQHRAFEDGQSAFLVGTPLASCRLRSPAKRNAWERGWRDAERIQLEQDALKNLSKSQKEAILSALGKIKDHLK